MHFVSANFATIAVALLVTFCHVPVLAALAVPDLDSPALNHVIKERSAEDDEYYDEYEEEYEDDDEDEDEEGTEVETVARIRITWSNDEEDLYVDHHMQTARMWGIVQGTEGEDSITIAEDDLPPPPPPSPPPSDASDSTMLFTYSTQAPSEYTPQDAASPTEGSASANMVEQRDMMLQNMFGLMYLGGGEYQDLAGMRSFAGMKDTLKNALFGGYSYTDVTNEPESTSEAISTAEVPTREGESKKLWAMGAVDLEITTTPDYNRLVLQQAFGKLLE